MSRPRSMFVWSISISIAVAIIGCSAQTGQMPTASADKTLVPSREPKPPPPPDSAKPVEPPPPPPQPQPTPTR